MSIVNEAPGLVKFYNKNKIYCRSKLHILHSSILKFKSEKKIGQTVSTVFETESIRFAKN
jgi:hypothetical protein